MAKSKSVLHISAVICRKIDEEKEKKQGGTVAAREE